MAKPIISLKIDVKKINKDLLFVGAKGTYLDATLMRNDEIDQYGNAGFVTQSVTKEQRAAGVKGPIIGNYRMIELNQKANVTPPPAKPRPQADPDLDPAPDDIPF